MPVSPLENTDGALRVTVMSDGAAIADTVKVVSVQVDRAVNRVPSARLVLHDGDMPSGTWPLANSTTFAPGADITIKAGYGEMEDTIFEGVVVKITAKVTGDNVGRLVVDCQDKAVRMTVGRKSASYIDKTDQAIIEALVSGHGLAPSVDSTAVTYPALVQYACTDWDFMRSRASANGLLVIATDGAIAVRAPNDSDAPDLAVTYGIDLIEFEVELDARTQLAGVEAAAWDPANQSLTTGGVAQPASLNRQGDLSSADLARVVGSPTHRLQSASALAPDALGAWARAEQVKAGLSRIRGRIKFQGSAKARLAGLIELKGVGRRFEGHAFVGALTHEIADGNWLTEAELGVAPDSFTLPKDAAAPAAAGWLPGADGLQIGVVLKVDDPSGEHRIQVMTPVLGPEAPGAWARLAHDYASNGFGAFFQPEVGDEVVLGYFGNDPSQPVVLGSLHSSARPPPFAADSANNGKALVTRSGIKIAIDDRTSSVTIATPAGNRIVLSDAEASMILQDQTGNKVTLDAGGVVLDSPRDIRFAAKGSIVLDAVGAVSMTSKADIAIDALNITCDAKVGFAGKGVASAELSANGQTVVRGAMVMIN